MLIGVTGGSGTGKSSLASLLTFKVIDADKLYHNLLNDNNELKNELLKHFGSYERQHLANIVFSDKTKLDELNAITFKYTKTAIINEIPPDGNAVIDVPLLFESGLDDICDFTIAVLAEKKQRIKRIMARDGLDRQKAIMRINAQKPDEFYIERADFVVYNNDENLQKSADELIKKLNLATNSKSFSIQKSDCCT